MRNVHIYVPPEHFVQVYQKVYQDKTERVCKTDYERKCETKVYLAKYKKTFQPNLNSFCPDFDFLYFVTRWRRTATLCPIKSETFTILVFLKVQLEHWVRIWFDRCEEVREDDCHTIEDRQCK